MDQIIPEISGENARKPFRTADALILRYAAALWRTHTTRLGFCMRNVDIVIHGIGSLDIPFVSDRREGLKAAVQCSS